MGGSPGMRGAKCSMLTPRSTSLRRPHESSAEQPRSAPERPHERDWRHNGGTAYARARDRRKPQSSPQVPKCAGGLIVSLYVCSTEPFLSTQNRITGAPGPQTQGPKIPDGNDQSTKPSKGSPGPKPCCLGKHDFLITRPLCSSRDTNPPAAFISQSWSAHAIETHV